jgi:hypothetical protein
MKSWIAKFRISSMLDGGEPLPESAGRKETRPADIRAFKEVATELGRALRTEPRNVVPPSSLHRDIMRSVREARAKEMSEVNPSRGWSAWRLAPASAIAACVTVAWLVAQHHGSGPVSKPGNHATLESLAVAQSALEMGGQITRTIPDAMVSPLTDELERVNQDLTSTANFLLASLP